MNIKKNIGFACKKCAKCQKKEKKLSSNVSPPLCFLIQAKKIQRCITITITIMLHMRCKKMHSRKYKYFKCSLSTFHYWHKDTTRKFTRRKLFTCPAFSFSLPASKIFGLQAFSLMKPGGNFFFVCPSGIFISTNGTSQLTCELKFVQLFCFILDYFLWYSYKTGTNIRSLIYATQKTQARNKFPTSKLDTNTEKIFSMITWSFHKADRKCSSQASEAE